MKNASLKFLLPAIALLTHLVIRSVQAVEPDIERASINIASAEAAVKRAAERHALWTSASEALILAKKLLADGKLQAAVAQANLARELAELGIAQTQYPLFCEG